MKKNYLITIASLIERIPKLFSKFQNFDFEILLIFDGHGVPDDEVLLHPGDEV